MADMKVRVSINNQNRDTIRTIGVGAVTGVTRLSQLTDVNVSGAQNNDALVYDSASGKFVSKTLPIVNGGNF
jgi:hypothetical protein